MLYILSIYICLSTIHQKVSFPFFLWFVVCLYTWPCEVSLTCTGWTILFAQKWCQLWFISFTWHFFSLLLFSLKGSETWNWTQKRRGWIERQGQKVIWHRVRARGGRRICFANSNIPEGSNYLQLRRCAEGWLIVVLLMIDNRTTPRTARQKGTRTTAPGRAQINRLQPGFTGMHLRLPLFLWY